MITEADGKTKNHICKTKTETNARAEYIIWMFHSWMHRQIKTLLNITFKYNLKIQVVIIKEFGVGNTLFWITSLKIAVIPAKDSHFFSISLTWVRCATFLSSCAFKNLHINKNSFTKKHILFQIQKCQKSMILIQHILIILNIMQQLFL